MGRLLRAGQDPDAVVLKLNAEINELMKAPDVQAKLAKIGFEPIFKNLPETDAYFKSEVANWGKMVRAAGRGHGLAAQT